MSLEARSLSLVVAALLAAAPAFAQQQKADLGKREFDANCASCHGASGKGDGPNKPWMTKAPPDLTVIAKNNGGVLPFKRLYEVIDGTAQVGGHGSSDMPVWGRDYRVKAAEYYFDTPYDPEVYVRGRILALIDYLNRIQAR
jgi:mono/diheme cytochrome c family protein